jgi:hypothetical protein
MECEGGQSPVFYNLPVLIAALLTWRAAKTQARVNLLGGLAMLAIGVALQIKYTVVFEGVFFGLTLLWAQYRATNRLWPTLMTGILCIATALLPTLLAALYYAHLGQLDAFIFANFVSVLGKAHNPLPDELVAFGLMILILAPLLVFAFAKRRAFAPGDRFLFLWMGAAFLGVLLYGHFLSPSAAMPLIAPGAIASTKFLADRKRGFSIALLVLLFAAGQIVIHRIAFLKGGRTEAMAIAAAARPQHGCIYVYDGYPALYMLTQSCLPSRWVFPGHLNTRDEASVKSLGVDPAVELERILSTRPEVIVDNAPAYKFGNPTTRAILDVALAKDYRLAATVKTGTSRYRLVYRIR